MTASTSYKRTIRPGGLIHFTAALTSYRLLPDRFEERVLPGLHSGDVFGVGKVWRTARRQSPKQSL
jgi:hypothetical protein